METGNGRSLELVLPWPLSVNSLYRSVRGRNILSKAGRQYHIDALASILTQGKKKFSGRVSVEIKLYPPDSRRRDLDNHTKITLDTLTHAGIWDDDEQIDDLRVLRMPVMQPGRAVVRIEEIK
jgi:crossover junction endodeoxyribonuclease RusA